MASEVPVRGPLAEAGKRGQRDYDLVVLERGESSKSRSEHASPSTYAIFVREKPSSRKSSGVATAIRSRVGNSHAMLVLDAEVPHEPAPDRGRRVQRDLLRRDRDD